MIRFSIEPLTKELVKGYGFLSFKRNLSKNYGKQLLEAATKTGQETLKTATRK